MNPQYRKYFVVMILCFLYGGFAIIASGLLLFSTLGEPNGPPRDFVFIRGEVNGNFVDQNMFAIPVAGQRVLFERSPPRSTAVVASPIFAALLASGLISIAAGFTIWGLTREKEIKAIKEQAADNLLLPDEKKLIDALKASNYELTQSKLTKESGLTKVQVHRTIRRLESKGVIQKHKYGLTNKILLKKEIFQ